MRVWKLVGTKVHQHNAVDWKVNSEDVALHMLPQVTISAYVSSHDVDTTEASERSRTRLARMLACDNDDVGAFQRMSVSCGDNTAQMYSQRG